MKKHPNIFYPTPAESELRHFFGRERKTIEAKVTGSFDPDMEKMSDALIKLIQTANKKYNIEISDEKLFGFRHEGTIHYFKYNQIEEYNEIVSHYSKTGIIELICYHNS